VALLSAGGELSLCRGYYWCGQQSACPADGLLGMEAGHVSPGARQICCRLGMLQNFAQAAEDVLKLGGLKLGREKLRQVVEAEAAGVTALRQQGKLPAAWSARGQRLYVGADGVLVPTITQAEKQKRRRSHIGRRANRARHGKGNQKPLPALRKGTDQRYKEVKLGVFYDQDKEHRHAFASSGGPEQLGELLRSQGSLIDLPEARDKRSVTDAAAWILRQLDLALPMLDGKLIDFYHLGLHVYQAAEVCLGETLGRAWALKQLQAVKERGPTPLLKAIEKLRKQVRSAAKREALRQLEGYVRQHERMMDYPREIKAGRDIGSGPTEAMCKTLSRRLKGSGMRWDLEHAQDLMNLTAIYESGQADTYWKTAAA
jgi:hypothetical protein